MSGEGLLLNSIKCPAKRSKCPAKLKKTSCTLVPRKMGPWKLVNREICVEKENLRTQKEGFVNTTICEGCSMFYFQRFPQINSILSVLGTTKCCVWNVYAMELTEENIEKVRNKLIRKLTRK